MAPTRTHADYRIGIICALAVEKAAVVGMLDEQHTMLKRHHGDKNDYTFGCLAKHNVVVVCLPAGMTGNNAAAVVASDMRRTFSLDFGLMVGIGGGVWSEKHDIRLGDVVVSHPDGLHGGVVQWDFGKNEHGKFKRTGSTDKPPKILLNAVQQMKEKHLREGANLLLHLRLLFERYPRVDSHFNYQGASCDNLYQADYEHIGGESCNECDLNFLVTRRPRPDTAPIIHYGNIASGNQVVKDGCSRDGIARAENILCFEMEAAGLVDHFPCLVIRGICDYADSHKNKKWQPYAAATAAACAREILSHVPEQCNVQATMGALPFDAAFRSNHDHGNDSTPNQHLHQEASSFPGERDIRENEVLVESLAFPQMDARHLNVRRAHSHTCEWLFQTSEYKDWYNRNFMEQHHGFFWIKGKPGSGKSTIMKEAISRACRKNRGTKNRVVIKFFFNARAEDLLEKSTFGMYRSLCYQLITAVPHVQGHFVELFKSRLRRQDGQFEWTVPELQNFLSEAAEMLDPHSLFIFIDALDECGEREIRDMVTFLRDLARRAIVSEQRLHICLSSRHYPQIRIHPALSVVLENQNGHEKDINTYIMSMLDANPGPQLRKLRDKIREKASGVFLWVALVVDILNELDDKGEVSAMERRLEEIPKDLDDLFSEILTRHPKDRERAIQVFQWTLFSRRPLKPIELYCAVKSSTISEEPINAAESEENIKKFLLHYSKGLTEITKSEPPRVQFIHETVRTFFLQNGGLARVQGVPNENIVGLSHDQLKLCCSQYCTLVDTPPEIQQEGVFAHFPFLEYATVNVLHHADAAEQEGISQESFLSTITSTSGAWWQRWISCHNLITRYKIQHYTQNVAPIYVFSEKNLFSLVKSLVQRSEDINVEGERYGTPLQAACFHGHIETASLLLEARASVETTNGEYGHPLLAAARNGHLQVMERIIPYCSNFDVAGRMYRKVLHRIAKKGQGPILRLLIDKATNISVLRAESDKLLCKSCELGHVAVVKLLLDNGVDINVRDEESRTALYIASDKGFEEIVKLLLNNGANVNAQGGGYGNALQAASYIGSEAVVKLLLNNGANINAQGGEYRNALQAAAASYRGSKSIVKLLLDNGADVNAQGGRYGNALQTASYNGSEAVVKLLLDNGADVNAQGGEYGNALQAARSCYGSSEAVVQLLLDHGAEEL